MAHRFCLRAALAALLLFASSDVPAADEEKPAEQQPSAGGVEESAALPAGHSQHGEAFNEGPRQKAYLMGGTGSIRFEVTSPHPQVQAFIEQGIGQLHGFWYFEAERSFRHAAMLDPDCAIAYWGMASANPGNTKREKGFIEQAVERRSFATEREAMYIDALDAYINGGGNKKEKAKQYLADLQAIADRYPDDLEAKAAVAYAMYKYRGDLGKKYEEAEAALKDVLAVEPMHPVHHYLIHLWDYKDPAKALPSAARCGQTSPAIAHMWHMPGHIYSRLKRYEDAVWQQEASARTDHAHMMREGLMPDAIHNFAHNNEWLIRNLIYIGRWRDAVDLAKNMIELPRHPKYNTVSRRKSTYYGRVRLFDTLKRYEQWEQLVALTSGPYLEPTNVEEEQVRRLRHRGIAAAELRNRALVDEVLSDLNQRLNAAQAKAKAEEEKEKEKEKEKKDDKKKKSQRGESPVQRLEKAVAAVEGRLAVAEGDFAKALPLLKKAGEDEFFQARVQLLSGDKEAAVKTIANYVKSRENQVHPLAVQIELLWLADKKEEAKQAFEQLRGLSGSIQLGAPVFDRLGPIAIDLGYGENWRVPRSPPTDVGVRPELDALGSFRWQPVPAPQWRLKDHQDKVHSLADYQGKPVIAIFYLGFGCLHCAQQLQAFAPMTDKFKEAGISLIAISTDDREGLSISLKNYEGKIPFPLVSDAALDVFRAYRVFDDFEEKPLHGTFLIDGEGKVRWHDISYEPFMDAAFLLEESRRLLAQSRPLPPAAEGIVSNAAPATIALSDLPRIDPAGIGGSLVLAGSDLPQEAVQTFLRMGHGEAARAVVLALDDSDAAQAAGSAILNEWNAAQGKDLRFVRLAADTDFDKFDWAALLDGTTALWIAGQDPGRWLKLVGSAGAKTAWSEFLHSGNVIGTSGSGCALLASQAFVEDKSSRTTDRVAGLLPDSLIDTLASSREDQSRLDEVLSHRRDLIGYELDANAALVVRGRRMWSLGEGGVRIHVGPSDPQPARQLTLRGPSDRADLTALRRAGRDRLTGNFPPAQPRPAKVDRGTLILVGGGGMPKGIISRFVQLAGGNDAHIVVLPTALPDPLPERDGIADEFRKAGAKNVTVLPGRTLDVVESEEYLSAFKSATGIWFGGGRQWRFVDAYGQTQAHQEMLNLLKRGGVIMGSSAGASIQAEFLARGNPLGNLDIMAEGYQRGLGFLPGTAVDQHFAQRNRFDDMRRLVRRYPQILGIGIDEAAALVVQGQMAEVVGRGDAHFFDGGHGKAGDYVSVKPGGRYDLVQRKELPPGVDPRQVPPSPPVPPIDLNTDPRHALPAPPQPL